MSLDPVPRAMPHTVLSSGSLPVLRGGTVVTLPGDDPRAAEVEAALAAQEPLGPVLSRLGVSYAVVASDLPDADRDLPEGSQPLYLGSSFSLYALTAPHPETPSRSVAAPAAALSAYIVVLAGAAVACGFARARRSR